MVRLMTDSELKRRVMEGLTELARRGDQKARAMLSLARGEGAGSNEVPAERPRRTARTYPNAW